MPNYDVYVVLQKVSATTSEEALINVAQALKDQPYDWLFALKGPDVVTEDDE